MANYIFNAALGRIPARVAAGATVRLLLLKATGAEATLKDFATVADVLGEAATTEADFTNYARKTLANVVATVRNVDNDVIFDFDDVVFTAAGGATNNNVVSALVYEEVTNDAGSTPWLHLDTVITTNGTEFVLKLPANGVLGIAQAV